MQGVAVLDSVRTGKHDGFERIVFVFRGSQLPGYVVEYQQEEATHCASGAPIAVGGAARLHIRLSPAQAHAPVGDEERATIENRSMRPGLPVVQSLIMDCDFEGVIGWSAGLSARRPYQVQALTSPTRLVVDIASP
jgi:hypothetical protein